MNAAGRIEARETVQTPADHGGKTHELWLYITIGGQRVCFRSVDKFSEAEAAKLLQEPAKAA